MPSGPPWRTQRQGWLGDDFSRMLERRKPRPDHTRALTRAAVEQLLTREDILLRERTFWSLLYETAARAEEVLALDIEDLDRPNRKARVRRKGGVDTIDWQARTARLLPRLIGGRTTGPLFVTSRKARVELPAAHLDERGRGRLSYQQAEALFKEASGGATLHQVRHSKLTHEAENGVTLPVLMALSGRTSVRSLAKYAASLPKPRSGARPSATWPGDSRSVGRSDRSAYSRHRDRVPGGLRRPHCRANGRFPYAKMTGRPAQDRR